MTKRAWVGGVLLTLLLGIGHVWAGYPELSPGFLELRDKILKAVFGKKAAIPEDEEQAKHTASEGWARLRGDLFEGKSYRIPHKTALTLLSRDKKGKLLPTPPGQNHPVVAHDVGVHFKANEGPVPLNPGMESAIGAFQEILLAAASPERESIREHFPPTVSIRGAQKRADASDLSSWTTSESEEESWWSRSESEKEFNLFASGIAPSSLLSLEGVSLFDPVQERLVQTTVPLQASLTVHGKSFKDHLREVTQGRASLDQITLSSFSALMLGSLLSHPADNKPGNFMLSDQGDGRFDLVAIDNDMAFANPISFALTAGPSPKTLHKVDVKNILYCLTPLMNQRVDEGVKENLLTQSPEILVFKWLATLEAKNKTVATLGLSEDDRTNLSLPLHLPPGFVPRLIADLRKLQAILRDQPHVTHRDVFQFMQPLMAAYYQKILTDYEQMREIARFIQETAERDPRALPLSAKLKKHFNTEQSAFQPYIPGFETFTRILEDREGGFNFYGAYHRIHDHNRRVPLEEMLDLQQKMKVWDEPDAPLYQLLRRETTPEEDPERDRIETISEAALKLVSSIDLSKLEPTFQEVALKTLAQQFSDLTVPDNWKEERVLYPLIQRLEPPVSKLLLPLLNKWGVNLNELLTPNRGTLLHHALLETGLSQEGALFRLQQNIEIYLAAGLQLETTDGAGNTVLDLALQKGTEALPVVTQLIRAGAGQKLKRENLVDFYRALLHTGAFAGDIQEAFHLLETRNVEAKWFLTYERILLFVASHPEDLEVGSALYGTRYLPHHLIARLWAPNSQFIKANRYGRCEVGRVSLDESHSLYFKKRPELGGLGYAASRLLQGLCGHGAPFMDLIWIQGDPFLVSQGVEGDTLQDILKDPAKLTRLRQLDPDRTAEFILMTLLLCPEDGKPDNYILHPRQDGTYELVGIDDEHAFASPFTSTLQEGGIKVYPHMKSVIFCLDQMGDPISPEIKKHFLRLDPAAFLRTWLQDLERVNTCFMDLFPETHAAELFQRSGSLVGIMFTEGMMARLYDRIINLQHILSEDHPALTPFEVMKRLEPELVKRYSSRGTGEAFDPSLTIQERFKQAEGKYYKVGREGECLSSTSATSYLRAHGIPVHADTLKAIKRGDMGPARARLELERMIETVTLRELGVESLAALCAQLTQLTTEHERATFLRQLNLSPMDGPQQRAWLEVLQSLPCRHLSLEGCGALTEAYLSNRPDFQNLISLGTPNCHQLTDTLFDVLAQRCFALEHINLSDNPNLQKIAEKPVLGGNRPLTFPYLRHLQLNDCSALESVRIIAPGLRVCELNRSPKMRVLNLKAPLLKRLEMREHVTLTHTMLASWVYQWGTLEELSLEGCGLIEGKDLFEHMPQFFAHDWPEKARMHIIATWLTKSSGLNLRKNQIGARGAEALARMLENNTLLRELNLEENHIGPNGVEALTRGLEPNTTLTKLHLRVNQSGPSGAEALTRMLEHNRSLTQLDLAYNQVSDSGAEALGHGLERTKALRALDLGCNQIGDSGAEALGRGLKHNTTLTTLHLMMNPIGDSGAEALGRGLKHNTTLTTLYLWMNHVGARGAEALGRTLGHNTTLTTLHLWHNRIGERGAEALGRGLEQNRTLRVLNLGGNQIGDSGAEALGRGLEHNRSLTVLDLGWNQIGASGAEALGRGLAHNTSVTELDLGQNQIGASGAEAFARMLEHNTTLTVLDLGWNQIGDRSAEALGRGLEQNTSLTTLDLMHNLIDDVLLAPIEAALKHNKQLHLSAQPDSMPPAMPPVPSLLSRSETKAESLPPEIRAEGSEISEAEALTQIPSGALSEEGASLYRPSSGDRSEHTTVAFTFGRSASPLLLAKFFHHVGLSHKPLHQLTDVIFANGPSVSYTCAALAAEDGQTPYFSTKRICNMFERREPLILGSLRFSDTLTTLCTPYQTCPDPSLRVAPHRSLFSTRAAQKNACVDFKIEDLVKLYSHPERATEFHPAPLSNLGRAQAAFEAITYRLQPDLEANLSLLAIAELEQHTSLPSRRMLFSIDDHHEEIASTRLNPHNHCALTPSALGDADEDALDRLLEGNSSFFRRLSECSEEESHRGRA